MKRKYTTAIHVQRLKWMLKKQEPCRCCPATKNFEEEVSLDLWSNEEDEIHIICNRFINYTSRNGLYRCPCHAFGSRMAITRTLKAIKEYENERKRL